MSTASDRAAWIKGGEAQCSVPHKNPVRPWRLVLLGAPGVGKGTQAELLADKLGACHLSTGDIFRAAKSLPECDRSAAITDALGYMKRGELVPDLTVLSMVRERTRCLNCGGGFLLDGFPRTLDQAMALDALFKSQKVSLDAVIDYRLPLDTIVSRLSGRRTCKNCKAVFHVTGKPPKTEGTCDHCAGELIQREDDQPQAIRVRMKAYETSTAPLTEFYAKKNLLVMVSAEGSPQDILARTLTNLGKLA